MSLDHFSSFSQTLTEKEDRFTTVFPAFFIWILFEKTRPTGMTASDIVLRRKLYFFNQYSSAI
jgi:hypothetical protein